MTREQLQSLSPLLRSWCGAAEEDGRLLSLQLRSCLALVCLQESGLDVAPWCCGRLEFLVGAALERAGEACEDVARLLYAAMDASCNSESLGGEYVEQCRALSERVIDRFLENRPRYEGDEEAERSIFRLALLNLYGVSLPDGEVFHPGWRVFMDSLLGRWAGEAMGASLWPSLSEEQRLRRHTTMMMESYMMADGRYAGLLERSYGELVLAADVDGEPDFGCLSALYDAALDGTDGLMPDLALMAAAAERCDQYVLGSVAPVLAGDSAQSWAPSTCLAEALCISVRHCCWQLAREADARFDDSF